MRNVSIFLVLCLASLSLWGCMPGTYSAGPAPAAEPAPPPPPSYRFEDLPVPSSMNLVRAESYIFEGGGLRAAIMAYTGKDDPGDLVKFYRDNMPQHNWQLVSIFEHEEATLNFRKTGWNCTINVAKKPMETKMMIWIGPANGEKKG